ncbi:MAG: hypothetical protein E6K79_00375 [Candidatus Eisenbacteria bacterium]|uniref:SPOR domain-containing protein n=1 Tax=Eiseniibacteriota bacterium TaxID=2212470 RepID=A0A538TUC4_UNCEI|nr:MAG: hypothetical protein E6K79_00375 [Candidatus Eisenbacteria bacterium]
MARIVLTTLLSIMSLAVFPASANSSCETEIDTKSRYLSFMAYETHPIAETNDSTGLRNLEVELTKMWSRLARGLATAVNCQRRVESDSLLSKVLSLSPISLMSQSGRPIQAVSDIDSHEAAPSDSLLSLFRDLDRDSSAELFTVLLGSFARKPAAESFMVGLGYSPDREIERSEARMDTTMVMDIVYSDCSREFDRAKLFILPRELTADGKAWVLSGLFYSHADAQRSLGRHRLPGKRKAQVIRLRFTAQVLRSAFPLI